MQLRNQVAIVRQGRVAAVVDAKPFAPRLVAARPAALLASSSQRGASAGAGTGAGASAAATWPSQGSNGLVEGTVTLWGYGISHSHDMVVCRQAGELPAVCLPPFCLPPSHRAAAHKRLLAAARPPVRLLTAHLMQALMHSRSHAHSTHSASCNPTPL